MRDDVIDAQFTVIRPGKRPKGMEDWPDESYAEWRAKPFWRRYRLYMAPGWWISALVAGALALGHSLSQMH